MDSFDIKILDIVQRDNRIPTEQIARDIGLSPSAVQRRLKKMRSDGTIEADVSIVSPAAIGINLLAIVDVRLRREIAVGTGLKEFKEAMITAREVIQCFLITGSPDFVLIVALKDMQEYERFTQRYFIENANVSGFETNVVINRVKSGVALPLPFEKD